MSNPNYTHIVLLVDASGSMEKTKQATIDGINNFIESQKRAPQPTSGDRILGFEEDTPKCTASLVMFSGTTRTNITAVPGNGEPDALTHNHTKLYDGVDIADTIALTASNYDTYGGTPLRDAFYKVITDCDAFINKLPENSRPGRIIVVSITDGEENESKRYSQEQLRKLIADKTALNWQFIYLGANQDAFTTSASYGVAQGQSLNFMQDDAGIARGFSCLTTNVLQKRSVEPDIMMSCCISDMDTSVASKEHLNSTTNGTTLPSTFTSWLASATTTIKEEEEDKVI
jgi:uncharacterized protein YegL